MPFQFIWQHSQQFNGAQILQLVAQVDVYQCNQNWIYTNKYIDHALLCHGERKYRLLGIDKYQENICWHWTKGCCAGDTDEGSPASRLLLCQKKLENISNTCYGSLDLSFHEI